jgi:hypothetical protein
MTGFSARRFVIRKLAQLYDIVAGKARAALDEFKPFKTFKPFKSS